MRVDGLLRTMQSAVSVAHLYPREHPSLVVLLDRAVQAATDATTRSCS